MYEVFCNFFMKPLVQVLLATCLLSCHLEATQRDAVRGISLTNVTKSDVQARFERRCNPADVVYSTVLYQGDTQVEVDADLSSEDDICLVVQRIKDMAISTYHFRFTQDNCEIVIADDVERFGFIFASDCSVDPVGDTESSPANSSSAT